MSSVASGSTPSTLPSAWLPAAAMSGDEEHVPSPAPGDSGGPGALSPQRKLSVIPEVSSSAPYNQPQVPGFSRPPSLAELAVAKQSLDRREEEEEECLEIIVSGSKQEQEVVYSASSSGNQHGGYYDPMVCLPAMERIHQHSIESSIVTEGHYDASFETEDFPTGVDSFDVAYNEDHRGGRLPNNNNNSTSNGHFKPLSGVTNGGTHGGAVARMNLDRSEQQQQQEKSQLGITNNEVQAVQPLSIKSIPSEVELVREGEGGLGGEVTLQPQPGGMMLWKRVRHCVVFGGTVVKKKEKK